MKVNLLIVTLAANLAQAQFNPKPDATCDFSFGCESAKNPISVIKPGIYCGYCWAVQLTGSTEKQASQAFYVSGKSGQGSCCSYGFRQSCADYWNDGKGEIECPVNQGNTCFAPPV
ncbi:hypothetical protein IQ07DRAFT_586003, partial [Pyrenochaeta sp. DS3sAY3a]